MHESRALKPTICQNPIPAADRSNLVLLPMSASRVAAGFPSPATDYMEGSLDLNQYLIKHKAATYLFEVKGDSMQGAGIMDGDKVVVDRSVQPRHGNIVIAVIDGEFTIKRLHRGTARVELRPENPAYQAIYMSPETQMEIWGDM